MASYEGQITLINVNDGVGAPGAPGPTYIIETNQDEILRFAETETEVGFSFSPEQLEIQVRKFSESESESEKQNIDFNNVYFYLYNNKTWTQIDWNDLDDYTTLEEQKIVISLSELVRSENSDLTYLVGPLISAEIAFKIEFYVDHALAGAKIIGVRYGLSTDMARLSLNANGIVASMQDSKLVFNSDGLTIKNGSFRIQSEEGTVLGADENGNLEITGIINAKGGIFHGRIEAEEGYFKGLVEAAGGKFTESIEVEGQLEIGSGDDKIYIGTYNENGKVEQGIFSGDFLEGEETGFCLRPDGSIIANTIELGESASIRNFLRLGDNCYLYNPTVNNGQFIVVKKDSESNEEIISLTNEGILKIGKDGIILNGESRTIHTDKFVSGANGGWSISPDRAEFNNIVARGTIESSVLAHGKIQTVGGILLVRPSTIIKSYEATDIGGYIIEPETIEAGFVEGDYCQISNQGILYRIQGIDAATGKITLIKATEAVTLQEPVVLAAEEEITSSITGEILISYGQTTENGDSIGIAINSSDNSASVAPHAISIFKNVFTTENGLIKHSKEPVIVLGEMSGEGYGGLKGYGLYADNVYLKGSLISEGELEGRAFYSGINTKSGVKMPESDSGIEYFPGKDKGEILFWAGANSSNANDIANAPFKVDSYGNLYAGSGFFNGTIISNASITAARIRAAVIEGWSLEANTPAALSIIDVQQAINFSKRIVGSNDEESFEEIMTLSDDKMRLSIPLEVGNFDENNNFTPRVIINPEDGSLQIERFLIKDSFGSKTEVGVSELTFLKYVGNSSNLAKTIIKADCGIGTLPSLQFHVMSSLDESENQILNLTSERSYFYNELQCSSNLLLSDVMEYRQAVVKDVGGNDVNVGYDLYIKE